MPAPATAYTIKPAQPEAHLFQVTCTVAQPDPAGQVFSMPAWIPGSYMIRDFAKNVVSLRASAHGNNIAVEKTDKQTWRCAPCDGPLTLEYTVYAWDLSVRTAHLDTTHAYFNGTSVFLCVKGQEHQPCSLHIQRPQGAVGTNWRVATAMTPAGATPGSFGHYRADDYAKLVDHPVEIGEFTRAEFDACGVPHELVISGRHHADVDRLVVDLKKICEHHIRFFGEPASGTRYVFLLWVVGDGYGGLEHRASSSNLCSRKDLPVAGKPAVSEGYRTLLSLLSHEYFHTWNVKRIRPLEFTGNELGHEVYTRQLWIFEGITSYFDDLSLLRTGLITVESYLELLARTITRLLRGSGRLLQTIEESSFDAWTRFYKQDENAPNAIVSYYTKGALIALALDLTLRAQSRMRVGLQDVMRGLWNRYGKTGEGVPPGAVEALCTELAGQDLGDFFEAALRSTRELPMPELLQVFGVEMHVRPANSLTDKGGPSSVQRDWSWRPGWLGVRIAAADGGVKLTHVLDHGGAREGGLAAGDVVVAVNGLKVTHGNVEEVLDQYQSGDSLQVHVFRRDELMVFDVTLPDAPADTCELVLHGEPDEEMRERRHSWLGC